MTSPATYTLTNEFYQASISSTGAELKSLTNHHTGQEYIWEGNPDVWGGTAPILFPMVGRLKNGQYQHGPETYTMPKHGFARHATFQLSTDDHDEKSFLLTASTPSLEQFPFTFELEVYFSLMANGITVRYDVRNKGDKPMLFTLGSHPAFSLPLTHGNLDDYYLELETEEQLDCYFLENGLLCTQPISSYLNNVKRIPISAALFENDALIFKDIKSRSISINHPLTGTRLTLHLGQAPHLGIWAKAGAPFICIEPWFSYDDVADTDGILANKPGIITLPVGQTFTTEYRIII